jgi:hypothetical protein
LNERPDPEVLAKFSNERPDPEVSSAADIKALREVAADVIG